jgi:glycine cleavage system aminomethyltransferase T
VSLEFLSPDTTVARGGQLPLARSPMERAAREAGARFVTRDGWNVAVAYGTQRQEAATVSGSVGWADVSHLGKLELQGPPEALAALCPALELGHAARADAAWWCPLTAQRVLVICEPAALPALRERLTEAAGTTCSVVELTSALAALTLVGPLARELFARFCALDLRPQSAPVGALRPGSVARQPGIVMCEALDRYLMLFGWAVAQHMWTVVADAGVNLGGAAVGADALAPLDAPLEEAAPSA